MRAENRRDILCHRGRGMGRHGGPKKDAGSGRRTYAEPMPNCATHRDAAINKKMETGSRRKTTKNLACAPIPKMQG
jgi:hypothetical protein